MNNSVLPLLIMQRKTAKPGLLEPEAFIMGVLGVSSYNHESDGVFPVVCGLLIRYYGVPNLVK